MLIQGRIKNAPKSPQISTRLGCVKSYTKMFNEVFFHHMANPITYMFGKIGNARVNGILRHAGMTCYIY